jgi:hypothetical protein
MLLLQGAAVVKQPAAVTTVPRAQYFHLLVSNARDQSAASSLSLMSQALTKIIPLDGSDGFQTQREKAYKRVQVLKHLPSSSKHMAPVTVNHPTALSVRSHLLQVDSRTAAVTTQPCT